MGWPLLKEELGDGLCNYCPLDDDHKGAHGTPNGYISCEGRACVEAYEIYLEKIAAVNNGWPEDCNACPCIRTDGKCGYVNQVDGSYPCDVMSFTEWKQLTSKS